MWSIMRGNVVYREVGEVWSIGRCVWGDEVIEVYHRRPPPCARPSDLITP